MSERNWTVVVGIHGKRGKIITETWTILGEDATQASDRAMSDLNKPWYKAPRGFVKSVEVVQVG